MKNIITVLILFISFSAFAAKVPTMPSSMSSEGRGQPEPQRGFISTHNAIESASLRISLDSNLTGFVEGKVCDLCETIKVTITPDTKAYEKNAEVPLIRAKNRIGRFATVIYEVDTKNVSAIRW